MRSRAARCSYVLLSLAGMGCGPTAREIGLAVIICIPAVLLSIALIHRLLLIVWKRLRPELVMGWRHALIPIGLSAVLAGITVPFSGKFWDGTVLAYVFYGSFCLGVDLIICRILIWRESPRAFVHAPLIALGLTAWPAPILILIGDTTTSAFFQSTAIVYVMGSVYGIVPSVMFFELLIEAMIRRRVARRHDAKREEAV